MDLTNLENALNNSNFKEKVYRSLEGIYQISNILNQLDIQTINDRVFYNQTQVIVYEFFK